MIEYLTENLWLLWTIIAMVCLIIELGSGDFFVTCFAIGALCSIIPSLAAAPFWLQVLVFAVCSVLSILFIRPSLLRHLHGKERERASNAEALIGREGVVIEAVEPEGSGYVRIDGDEWKAVTTEAETLQKGERVRVVAMESIVLTVERV